MHHRRRHPHNQCNRRGGHRAGTSEGDNEGHAYDNCNDRADNAQEVLSFGDVNTKRFLRLQHTK